MTAQVDFRDADVCEKLVSLLDYASSATAREMTLEDPCFEKGLLYRGIFSLEGLSLVESVLYLFQKFSEFNDGLILIDAEVKVTRNSVEDLVCSVADNVFAAAVHAEGASGHAVGHVFQNVLLVQLGDSIVLCLSTLSPAPSLVIVSRSSHIQVQTIDFAGVEQSSGVEAIRAALREVAGESLGVGSTAAAGLPVLEGATSGANPTCFSASLVCLVKDNSHQSHQSHQTAGGPAAPLLKDLLDDHVISFAERVQELRQVECGKRIFALREQVTGVCSWLSALAARDAPTDPSVLATSVAGSTAGAPSAPSAQSSHPAETGASAAHVEAAPVLAAEEAVSAHKSGVSAQPPCDIQVRDTEEEGEEEQRAPQPVLLNEGMNEGMKGGITPPHSRPPRADVDPLSRSLMNELLLSREGGVGGSEEGGEDLQGYISRAYQMIKERAVTDAFNTDEEEEEEDADRTGDTYGDEEVEMAGGAVTLMGDGKDGEDRPAAAEEHAMRGTGDILSRPPEAATDIMGGGFGDSDSHSLHSAHSPHSPYSPRPSEGLPAMPSVRDSAGSSIIGPPSTTGVTIAHTTAQQDNRRTIEVGSAPLREETPGPAYIPDARRRPLPAVPEDVVAPRPPRAEVDPLSRSLMNELLLSREGGVGGSEEGGEDLQGYISRAYQMIKERAVTDAFNAEEEGGEEEEEEEDDADRTGDTHTDSGEVSISPAAQTQRAPAGVGSSGPSLAEGSASDSPVGAPCRNTSVPSPINSPAPSTASSAHAPEGVRRAEKPQVQAQVQTQGASQPLRVKQKVAEAAPALRDGEGFSSRLLSVRTLIEYEQTLYQAERRRRRVALGERALLAIFSGRAQPSSDSCEAATESRQQPEEQQRGEAPALSDTAVRRSGSAYLHIEAESSRPMRERPVLSSSRSSQRKHAALSEKGALFEEPAASEAADVPAAVHQQAGRGTAEYSADVEVGMGVGIDVRALLDLHAAEEASPSVMTVAEQSPRSARGRDAAQARKAALQIQKPRASSAGRSARGTLSNYSQVKNAISSVCLAGTTFDQQRLEVLELLDFCRHGKELNARHSALLGDDGGALEELKASVSHFLVMFFQAKTLSFKGVYANMGNSGSFKRIYGKGPKEVWDDSTPVQKFMKFETASKLFKELPVKKITGTVDAIVLDATKFKVRAHA